MSRAYGANNNPNVDNLPCHYKRNRQSLSLDSNEINSYKTKRVGGGINNDTYSSSCGSSHSHNMSTITNDDNRDDDDRDKIGHIQFKYNDVYNDRYVCKSELGLGTFGKVFKCKDMKYDDYVAIKVIRKIDKYIESAQIEKEILDDIYKQQKRQRKNYCVKLYSAFKFDGHYFMVFETLGMSLLSLTQLNDFTGLPLSIVKMISHQILQGIEFLHSINLIHTDLKLENILFKSFGSKEQLVPYRMYNHRKKKEVTIYVPFIHDSTPSVTISVSSASCFNPTSGVLSSSSTTTLTASPSINQIEMKLIDFGGATYDNERKSTIISTRQYRSPEVTLEVGWSFPADIWSIGCIVYEIMDGELLFATHDNLEHLALMEAIIEPFPRDLVDFSPLRSKFFKENGFIKLHQLPSESQEFVDNQLSLNEYMDRNYQIHQENSSFVRLLLGLLKLDPLDRHSAKKALNSSFFS